MFTCSGNNFNSNVIERMSNSFTRDPLKPCRGKRCSVQDTHLQKKPITRLRYKYVALIAAMAAVTVFALNHRSVSVVKLGRFFVVRISGCYVKMSRDSTEIHVLNALADHEACHCDPPRQHFPRLVFGCGFGPLGALYATRGCGTSLDRVDGVTVPDDIDTQCDCIFNTMRRAGVRHRDLLPKNVCIDHDGTLALIDFEDADGPSMKKNYQTRRSRTPIPRDADWGAHFLRRVCNEALLSDGLQVLRK